MEEFIYKILNDNYGTIHEPIDLATKQLHHQNSLEGLDVALVAYKEHPSATNWNIMISAMVNYQYWEQKQVEE
tara:strand:+ start:105 stop:323 length:219 start_codon:yes stop_codon:yes gene_type:complete